jgi:hypothetical protein
MRPPPLQWTNVLGVLGYQGDYPGPVDLDAFKDKAPPGDGCTLLSTTSGLARTRAATLMVSPPTPDGIL